MRLKGSIGVCNAFIVFVFIRRKSCCIIFISLNETEERERLFSSLAAAYRTPLFEGLNFTLLDFTRLLLSELAARSTAAAVFAFLLSPPPLDTGHYNLSLFPFLSFFLSHQQSCLLSAFVCVHTNLYLLHLSLPRFGDANLIITICWAIITAAAGRGH